MKLMLKILIGACASAGLMISAQAVPVVSWSGTNTATFTGATFTGTGDVTTGVGPLTPVTTLSWGASNEEDRSSLTITDHATSIVETYYGTGIPTGAPYIAEGSSLKHHNEPITGNSLTGATIFDTLVLTAEDPDGSDAGLPSITFNIAFKETNNQNNCGFVSTSDCDDIFVLLGGFFNQSFSYDTGDGIPLEYFVNIFPIMGGTLHTLPDATCDAAGQDPGCFGFQTVEEGDTTMAFGYSVSSTRLAVPEPGSLALVGLALLGLGLTRRRTRKS